MQDLDECPGDYKKILIQGFHACWSTPNCCILTLKPIFHTLSRPSLYCRFLIKTWIMAITIIDGSNQSYCLHPPSWCCCFGLAIFNLVLAWLCRRPLTLKIRECRDSWGAPCWRKHNLQVHACNRFSSTHTTPCRKLPFAVHSCNALHLGLIPWSLGILWNFLFKAHETCVDTYASLLKELTLHLRHQHVQGMPYACLQILCFL